MQGLQSLSTKFPQGMGLQGYYQRPTICGDQLVFLYEDDLWLRDLSASSAKAYRLTSNLGRISDPQLSPDGKRLAYTSLDEGQPEIYVTEIDSMQPKRLTYLGDDTRCVGWSKDGRHVLFTTCAGMPFNRIFQLAQVSYEGGPPEALNHGPAAHISYGPGKSQVIGRHTWDPARWKRYRGGTAGQVWVDTRGQGQFRLLPNLGGNLTRPLFLGDRIYFGSDHDGICNLYSCDTNGKKLQQHSHHKDFFLRFPNTDGKRIVYQCGGDIYLWEPKRKRPKKVDIEVFTQRKRLARHFVNAASHIQDYSAGGTSCTLVSRGKAFVFFLYEGAMWQLGARHGVRYRMLRGNGLGVFAASDRTGEESISFFARTPDHHCYQREADVSRGKDIGRILNMGCSPDGMKLWFTNHRHELWTIELSEDWFKWQMESATKKRPPKKKPKNPKLRLICRDDYARIRDASFSPDSRWLAYSRLVSRQNSRIYLWSLETGEETPVTGPQFYDWSPDFDPEGRYLYFLSYRDFDPVKNALYHDFSFPKASRPYLVTLQADLADPFHDPRVEPGGDPDDLPSPYEDDEEDENEDKDEDKDRVLRIDLDGIEERLRVFPVAEGRYYGLLAAKNKVIFGVSPVLPILNKTGPEIRKSQSWLASYDFKKLKYAVNFRNVSGFELSVNKKTLIYRSDKALRAIEVAKMSASSSSGYGRESGWIDLSRVKVSIDPRSEWRQMFHEAWRLMRDQFWNPDFDLKEWKKVRKRYEPLLDRISTRRELSDLLWEFQGELGTSHAYEYGGDYRPGPYYAQGKLAATLKWDGRSKGYRILEMAYGDPRSEKETSPLRVLGEPLAPGDLIISVDGNPVGPDDPCEKFLVNRAEQRVMMFVRRMASDSPKAKPDFVEVLTLCRELPLRYRDWVENNRRKVHEASDGRLGYIHIPDMGPNGFAEFHRSYSTEMEREGLVIDVRYNGGGNVSGLILEKLSRPRLAFDVQRWARPIPYPMEAPTGPMVCLTNEQAGSDGDIFSHCFKMLKLGPLLGKRTWGGTIGIWPRHPLVDGTVTTQPEFAHWFPDAGWGVENYGTDPNEEIENRPQDWRAGKDPQLELAIERALEEIEKSDHLRESQIPSPE